MRRRDPHRPGGPPISTAAVPVGGGIVLRGPDVVITQPTAGTFVAFSAICTHEGCRIHAVAGGTINCFCHGSRFRISDGAVVGGPARDPLPQVPIRVADGSIDLG
ncbi:Rieske (2Fe-2S) protein [Pseudonocardia hispaniensis]|uniref:Cytochrome bc1 complex Rieske iron-sulfur subunit n=1 Tax=Pseudonocardia hispaniensis TaxID=904933 RepID=A0ABW1J099_9PSEU